MIGGLAVLCVSLLVLFLINLPRPVADFARKVFNKPRPAPSRRPYFGEEAWALLDNYSTDWLVLLLKGRGMSHDEAVTEAAKREAQALKFFNETTWKGDSRITFVLGILMAGPDAPQPQ